MKSLTIKNYGLVAVLLLCVDSGFSCPMCKDAVTSDATVMNIDATNRRATGYFYSIIGMLTVPMLLAGGISTALFLEHRSANRLTSA